jgi:hypothetical protein
MKSRVIPNTCGLVGMLLAAANVSKLPVQAWPLEVAFETLERVLKSTSSLRIAVAQACNPCESPRFSSLSRSVRSLARSGHLRAVGRGWEAGFAPSAEFIDSGNSGIRGLSKSDVAAIRRAADQLATHLTTWSNSSIAARPS